MYHLERHSSAGNSRFHGSSQSVSLVSACFCVSPLLFCRYPWCQIGFRTFEFLSLKEGTSVSPWPAPAECLRSPCRSHWTRCSWAQRWMSRWQWDQDCSRWWGGCCNSWTWWKALGSCPQTLRCRPPWSGQRVYSGIQERSQRCVHVVR